MRTSSVALLCALRKIAVFEQMEWEELQLLSASMTYKSYPSGECICKVQQDQSHASEILYLLLDGSWNSNDRPLNFPLANLRCVLFGEALRYDLVAGAQGAYCAHLARGHLFSLLRNSPQLALGLCEESHSAHALQELPL